jgi:hypothetical protein
MIGHGARDNDMERSSVILNATELSIFSLTGLSTA